ncbi:MAG: GDP-mannose 4,6-dehydratase [Pirellulales bacterium]
MFVGQKNRVAIISGVSGQDGSYLAELLLEHGYKVIGLVRNPHRLGNASHLIERVSFEQCDLNCSQSIVDLLDRTQADEFYHLAAPSFVPFSWDDPQTACRDIALVTLNILEALRKRSVETKFLQAGSSEMFGAVTESPQNEDTPFRPQNPYASAKVMAHNLVQNHRGRYGLFACNATLFNHESPRRGVDFVTRKITMSAAAIKLGLQNSVSLGSLDAMRDWGYAGDFVRAMFLMLRQDIADDYVIGTGKLATVQDVVEVAFERVGLEWQDWVTVDPRFVRPPQPVTPVADIEKARRTLGWEPTVSLRQLIEMMVDSDLEILERSSGLAPMRVVSPEHRKAA